jgi:hypothetical protein
MIATCLKGIGSKTNFIKIALFETTKAVYIRNPATKNLDIFDSQ